MFESLLIILTGLDGCPVCELLVEPQDSLTDTQNSGDLVNERSREEYERGYATLLKFL